jgi:hypothetical protein
MGSIGSSRLEHDAASGVLRTQAKVVLAPDRLHVVNESQGGSGRTAVDARMRRLVDEGLRAELAKSAPMIGSPEMRLRFVPGSDIDAIAARAGDVVAKIADEVHQPTQRVPR